MLVQPVLLRVGAQFAAMQYSYGRFIFPAVGLLLYAGSYPPGDSRAFAPHFGVYAAAWAVVAGAFVCFEIQIWGVVAESRYSTKPASTGDCQALEKYCLRPALAAFSFSSD